MRVGIHLDGYAAEAGGIFTFFGDIAEGLLKRAGDTPHELVLIPTPEAARQLQARTLPDNVSLAPLPARGRLGDVATGLRHYWPLAGRALPRHSRFERHLRAHGVEFLWFVGRMFETPDVPFMSIVCDLQHRTHPGFPEVSENWLWDHREMLYGRHLKRASRIMAGTQAGRAELERYYGIDPARVVLNPHPTPGFALRAAQAPQPARPMAAPFFFYPAQFWAHKNHVGLLLAWRKLIEDTGQAPKLVLVGSDKGNRAHVEAQVTALGLQDHVIFPGFVPIQTLIAYYVHAEAMIYPSFSGPENLPPLEAMALGTPVLASDFAGAREQMGEVARLFNPHDPDDIAAAVTAHLRLDAQARDAICAAGRRRAAAHTARDFVQIAFDTFDDFARERRSWA